MRRLGLELTDRCNLQCTHCLRAINVDRRDLPRDLAHAILDEAHAAGFTTLVFTGGEPTLHPHFVELAEHALRRGFALTVVTNGQTPRRLWELLAGDLDFSTLTVALSAEGADRASFDLIRGRNAYRRFLRTVLGLAARRVRFRLSFAVGAWNAGQLPAMLEMAERLGASGVSLAAFQPTARDEEPVDMAEHAQLLEQLERAADSAPVPVTLAFEPLTRAHDHLCSTLALDDLNINHRGEVTFCCQLSTLYDSPDAAAVTIADARRGLAAAVAAQARAVADFLDDKRRAWQNGPPRPTDLQPCYYCLRAFGQRIEREENRHAA